VPRLKSLIGCCRLHSGRRRGPSGPPNRRPPRSAGRSSTPRAAASPAR
jgi:hypothetical protein